MQRWGEKIKCVAKGMKKYLRRNDVCKKDETSFLRRQESHKVKDASYLSLTQILLFSFLS
jgi:hypothetical protein